MPRSDNKRSLRNLKREIKRSGNRKLRQHLKRTLEENPADAADVAFEFGRSSSQFLNGNDRDATRRRTADEE